MQSGPEKQKCETLFEKVSKSKEEVWVHGLSGGIPA
jgi:hypothetical protein